MSYRGQVARTAVRQLTEQLPKTVAAACMEFLSGPLAQNPHRGERRCGSPSRATGAQYRVRYTIDATSQTVQVLDISHRRDTYR
ncbi:MAG: type II toxin-antitoxin system RelE/ParE family toxin [Pseudonocardiales bacterium]|nr:type II toxin-antitoxin system RelE/ParE family toxin [Pseudonocardiales bacterium]